MSKLIPIPNEDIQALIVNDYMSGLTIKELKEKYYQHVSWGTLKKVLNLNNVVLKRSKPIFNRNFFTELTPVSAYWAGFMYADGSVTIRGTGATLKLSCSGKDTEHIKKFVSDINLNREVKTTTKDVIDGKVAGMPCKAKVLTVCRIGSLHCKEFIYDLPKYGIIPRKTYNFKEPEIPDLMLPHFIRGVIDGDGCITIAKHNSRIIINGHKEFILWLESKLSKIGYSGKYLIYHKLTKNGYELSEIVFASIKSVLELAEKLLYQSYPNLERKWSKIDLLKSHVEERNSKPRKTDDPHYARNLRRANPEHYRAKERERSKHRSEKYKQKHRELGKKYDQKLKELGTSRHKRAMTTRTPEQVEKYKADNRARSNKYHQKLKELGIKRMSDLDKNKNS